MNLAESDPRRGLLRLFLRAPILLYRLHLGWLLGERFLLLKHRGRKSGKLRCTVLEVVRPAEDRYLVASGWGTRSNWFQNIKANPAVELVVGTTSLRAEAVQLPQAEAKAELQAYAQAHPVAYRELAKRMLGQAVSADEAEFAELSRTIPLIALCKR